MSEIPREGISAAATAALMGQVNRGRTKEQGFRTLGTNEPQGGFKTIETSTVSQGGLDTRGGLERRSVQNGVSVVPLTKDAANLVSPESNSAVIHDLRENDARERLSSSLSKSDGKGIILVHP